jgi:hypothetical protein
VNEDEIREACSKVHKGQDKWAALGYVEGKKDEIAFVQSGSSLEDLKKIFPRDKILYVMIAQQVTVTTTTTLKYLLVTCVGDQTGPLGMLFGPFLIILVKARSGAHRAELVEFIKVN